MRGTCVRQELSIPFANDHKYVVRCICLLSNPHHSSSSLPYSSTSMLIPSDICQKDKKDTKRLRILNLKILNLMY